MTRKEIYEQVVALTAELARTKVAEKIFCYAEAGDAAKTQEVIDNFPTEYPELHEEIVSFGRKFGELVDEDTTDDGVGIFGTEADEDNNIHVFDAAVIDSLSFYTLTIMGGFNESHLFSDWDSEKGFFQDLEEAGYEALSEFAKYYSWVLWVGEEEKYATVGELLVAVFAEDFEDDEPTCANEVEDEDE